MDKSKDSLSNDARIFRKNWDKLDEFSKALVLILVLLIFIGILDAAVAHSTENILTQIIVYIKDLLPFLFFVMGQISGSRSGDAQGSKELENETVSIKQMSNNYSKIICQSDIEQLISLKALLDTNVLTDEEFKAKKKQILNI